MSYGFVAPYALLTLAFGVLPGALRARTSPSPTAAAASPGVDNFTKVIGDFRFLARRRARRALPGDLAGRAWSSW